jgi:alkanesulfonate monooxygenase SsuD/methylene tetrahydromethanopterin reductase-like flavin-dependent oxidoreductase (luciferase family)
MFIESRASSMIIGDPSTVEAGLEKLLDETLADELMITTMVHSNTDRIRSYELVKELAGRSVAV